MTLSFEIKEIRFIKNKGKLVPRIKLLRTWILFTYNKIVFVMIVTINKLLVTKLH